MALEILFIKRKQSRNNIGRKSVGGIYVEEKGASFNIPDVHYEIKLKVELN